MKKLFIVIYVIAMLFYTLFMYYVLMNYEATYTPGDGGFYALSSFNSYELTVYILTRYIIYLPTGIISVFVPEMIQFSYIYILLNLFVFNRMIKSYSEKEGKKKQSDHKLNET